MKKSIQTLLIVLGALLIMLFGDSCYSKSGERLRDSRAISLIAKPDSTIFRARRLLFYDGIPETPVSVYTELIKVPVGYLTGDTIMLGTATYLLGMYIKK